MNRVKRMLAVLLAVIMVVGVMPMPTKAAGGSTYNLQSGQELTFVRDSEEQVDYFKFKATADGYITVNIKNSDFSMNQFYLCNAKKKQISEYAPFTMYSNGECSGEAPVFGVKKNTTYHIYLEGAAAGETTIQYTLTPTKEKAGKKMKKAVNVKKNKLIKGSVYGGKLNEDWYKIKINKKCKVRFTVESNGTGRFRGVYLYTSKGKYKRNLAAERENVYQLYGYSKYTKTITLKKGTYYIKAANDLNGLSSFYYTFKWDVKK